MGGIFIVFLASIQFGGPSLFSVPGVACLFAALFLCRGLDKNSYVFLAAGAVVFLLPAQFYVLDSDYVQILGRQARIFFCYCLIVFSINKNINFAYFGSAKIYIIYFQFFCVALCFIQYIALRGGWANFVFLPYEIYGITAGDGDDNRSTTIPSYWIQFGLEKGLSFGVEYFLRPTAFYSEPSYLGFVMMFCSVFVFILDGMIVSRYVVISLAASFITSVVSESASALVALLIIFGGEIFKSKFGYAVKILFPLFCFFVLLFSGVLDRLASIGDVSGDVSGFIRFVKPLYNIAQVFGDGKIFGSPQSRSLDYFSPYFGSEYIGYGLDNGLFNIIMDLGLFALIYFYIVFNMLKKYILLIYAVVLMINGNYLGFDRAILMSILIVLHNSFENSMMVRKNK